MAKSARIKVKEVMSMQLLWVEAETDLLTVSQLMVQRDVGSILVKSGEAFVGIITEKDIIREVVMKGLAAQSVTAEMVMSYPIASIDQDALLDEARQRMGEQNFRHLLVTQNGKPVGMISVRTWLEALT